MDFLATYEGQLSVGVAVGLIAVAAAYILFSSKKPKGSLYYTFASVLWIWYRSLFTSSRLSLFNLGRS